MKTANRADGADRSARTQVPDVRIALWAAGVLLALTLAGCATTSRLASRRVPCVHGCPQAPLALRKALTSGNPAAEVAMGLREGNRLHFAGAQFWFLQAAAQGGAAGEFHVARDYAHGFGVARSDAQADLWYRKAAEQGYMPAEIDLAANYARGLGVPRNEVAAAAWYRKAATQGSAAAQTMLGYDYQLGRGVARNDRKAVQWLRRAAHQRDAQTALDLGYAYAAGRGVAQNDATAYRWYRRAAAEGNAYAEYDVALDYQQGYGVARNLQKANQWLHKAVRQRLAVAEYMLGYDYGTGLGVTRNSASANRWFHRAAIGGLVQAEFALATDYELARGCARNLQKANFWWRTAAAQGFLPAEYALGFNYDVGAGVAPNPIRAHYWIHKAAVSGFPAAEAALGVELTDRGRGTRGAQGIVWLRKAAAQNNVLAEYYLGAAYDRGWSVARNVAKAHAWWRKARANAEAAAVRARGCRLRALHGRSAVPTERPARASGQNHSSGTAPPQAKRSFPSTCGFYPEVAQLLREQGTAVVRVCIGTDGELLHAPTLVRSSGLPRLDAAALRYASATSGEWIPARVHGTPISLCAKLPVRFALRKPGQAAGLQALQRLP